MILATILEQPKTGRVTDGSLALMFICTALGAARNADLASDASYVGPNAAPLSGHLRASDSAPFPDPSCAFVAKERRRFVCTNMHKTEHI